MLGIGGNFKLLLVCATDAMKPTQTLDAIEARQNALCEQLALNLLGAVALGHPVDAAAALMRGFDGNH